MTDKRKATWIAKADLRKDMRDCVKSDSAMYSLLGTNQKTGGNIKDGNPVKRDVLKDAINHFLTFLGQYAQGTAQIDHGKHHESDIKKIVGKYITPDHKAVDWETLSDDTESSQKR